MRTSVRECSFLVPVLVPVEQRKTVMQRELDRNQVGAN
jgi:hypothetical protein